ncbi:GNAT family N-acetyltransferase [Paenibacillus doosanensis]|uniref:GNAT family N-acetyltransferase n=1 Tax=Paenibacillus doosanensis TaxID=1229154 RepID=UPI0021807E08|nr:GNAT family N-acetyltransferase [Paenibacillus doosanensis]MCS7462165.1 GNAT family N-acetyltransferase [Paenibacillus doosanensis]
MEFRLVRNEELQQAVHLADSIFRDAEQSSMGTAFPLIFSPGQSHSYGAFADGKLVSFMGFVPFVLRVGAARLNVFSVGSVCTDPDYRGQGTAGRLLELCKRHADQAGASLIFVSGDRSLYTRAHCYHFGRTDRFTLDAAGAARLRARTAAHSGREIRPYAPQDAFALHAAADAREVAFAHSVTELQRLLGAQAHASCAKLAHEALVAAPAGGGVDSFAVIEAPGRYHSKRHPAAVEWGGPAEAVAALLADAVERFNLAELTVAVGWHERELALLLREAGVPSAPAANSGTVFVVSAARLLEQAAPYLRAAGGIIPAVGEQQEDGCTVAAEGRGSVRLSAGELVSLLFDPSSEQAASLPGWTAIPLPSLSGLSYT